MVVVDLLFYRTLGMLSRTLITCVIWCAVVWCYVMCYIIGCGTLGMLSSTLMKSSFPLLTMPPGIETEISKAACSPRCQGY